MYPEHCSVTSTSFLLRPTSILRWRCWPSQGHQQNCTHLPPNTGQTTRPSMSTSLCSISWQAGTTITESKQSSLSEVVSLLCSGTVHSGMNSQPMSGITLHLPQRLKTRLFRPYLSTMYCMTPFFFISYSINGNMLCILYICCSGFFLETSVLVYCKSLWTSVCKCPKCKSICC